MTSTFFSAPEEDIFLALIFKEKPGFWDSILGALFLDEEAIASFLATDGIIMALLLIECLPAALLLASEALLLASEAFLQASEAFLLTLEALLLVSEALLLESEPFLLTSEAFLLASEAFLLTSEALLLASEVLLLETEPFFLSSEAFFLSSEAFLLDSEAFLLEGDVFLLELEVSLIDPEAFILAKSLKFGPEDIFIVSVGTRFPLMRMDGISCFDFNAELLLVVILFDGVFFGLFATLLDVFR